MAIVAPIGGQRLEDAGEFVFGRLGRERREIDDRPSGAKWRECEQCGFIFKAGGPRGTPNARRADARFCSDGCRYRFNDAGHTSA
jgi:hypothetical protein